MTAGFENKRSTMSGVGDMEKTVYDPANGAKQVAFNDSVVHNTGNETVGGDKTFTGAISASNLSGTNTGDETTTKIGTLINGATEKTTPIDADMVGLMDSEATNILKKLSLANIKATLKTYFDTLYAKIGDVTSSGITMSTGKLLGRGTASTGAIEEITLGTGLSFSGTTLNGGIGGDTTNNIGYLNIPQNSQSSAYTLVLGDSGKHIYHPSADTTSRTFTIPANSSVAFPIGTAITFINDTSAGVLTIAITDDVLIFAGTGTTGSRTLAANGIATIMKITSTRWIINGTGIT